MASSTGKIFISYRRDDSAGDTGRIYDRLAQEFGRDNIFKDVDSIPFGVDFAQHIDQEVGRCQVLLVVMGKNWVTPRLQNPDDFVRLEIESALGRGIPVVPVFLEGVTSPPPRDQLPESLQPLIRRNGIQVGHDPRFHADMGRLVKGLRDYFQQPSRPVQPSPSPSQTVQNGNPSQVNEPTGPVFAGPMTGNTINNADTTAPESAQPPIPRPVLPRPHPSRRRALQILGWVGAGLGATFLGIVLMSPGDSPVPERPVPPQPSPDLTSSTLEDRLSFGEKLLVISVSTAAKQEGVRAFAQGDYPRAAKRFQQSLDLQRNDPESLIYLNNAQIGDNSALTIAVSVPIGSNPNVAQEILRGVAQAQNEVNRQGGLDGKSLRVQIANDDNDPELARKVADTLVGNKNILAVIGHNASNASLAAAPVYQQAGLVMITPTSYADQLSNFDSYIFQTVPNIQSAVTPLVDYIVRERQLKTIAICYDEDAPETDSFRDEFEFALVRRGGQQADTICDFAALGFNATLAMNAIRVSKAEAIVLMPHVDRINQAIALAQANQQRLPLYGSTALYTIKTLEEGGTDINGLVLPVPWLPTEPFASNAQQLWGGKVNWRTASAYDAAKALIAGLQQNSSRDGLQAVLQDPNFSAVGASSKVQFSRTGDRVGEFVLAEAVVNPEGSRFLRLQP